MNTEQKLRLLTTLTTEVRKKQTEYAAAKKNRADLLAVRLEEECRALEEKLDKFLKSINNSNSTNNQLSLV